MSAALYVVLEHAEAGLDTHIDGKALSRAESELEGLAHLLDIVPLMEFFSMSPEDVAAEAEAFGVQVDDDQPLPEQWFTASDGLKTARTLLQHVTAHPGSVPSAADVVRDLRDLVRVLEAAEMKGVRWHLAVDY